MEKILIVDDSATARMFVIRCLEIAGYTGCEFVEAASGSAALQVMKEHPVDMVITDLNMPEMDGTALVRRIMGNPKLNLVPVIVVSSGLNQPKKNELLGMGVQAVLEKPLTPPAVLQAVGEMNKRQEGAGAADGW